MTQTESEAATLDCIFENILGFLLPFFLSSAGGNADLACEAIRELAEAYNVATATELELVGRILGFSTVAMDNLRLSMSPEMSDTKVLRYRSNAVALSRAGEQCRKTLEVIQANRKPAHQPMTIPAPAIAAVPPPAAKAQPSQPAANQTGAQPSAARAAAAPSRTGDVSLLPQDIEAMKREAREMLAAFSNKRGQLAQPAAAFPYILDPATLVSAAVKQAFASAKPTTAA
jgi:hypothetical protein